MMRFIAICIVLLMFGLTPVHAENDIIVVSAEGLADGNFYKDRRVAYDEAVKDAKQQILDKAVGAFIDSETLVKNYQPLLTPFILSTRLYKACIKVSGRRSRARRLLSCLA